METEKLTYFASPERLDNNEVKRQKKLFDNLSQLTFFLDTVPNVYLILNEHRQIIFANKTALETLSCKNIEELIGKRPGEALDCIHADEMPGGCGTSEACQYCGAANAILSGLKNMPDIKECRISTNHSNDSLDFRVWTNPYNIGDEKFVIFSVTDISDEKRRRALEKIFFHDVLNTAGGIKGISALIQEFPEEIETFKDLLHDSSKQLISEIQAQRDLANAESGELQPYFTKLNSKALLKFLAGLYSNHDISKDKFVVVSPQANEIEFENDEALILRVLGNMTKNALEATSEGQTVTLNCTIDADNVKFSIHNSKFMPRKIQLQIFQRSFSTKGSGRGLGTYSMKLLSEKYLNGKVYFTSDEEAGTTFFAEYPIKQKF